MPNSLIFVDLPTEDPEAAAGFYRELFGWRIDGRPPGVFHEIVPSKGVHLGLFCEAHQVPDPAPKSPRPRSGLQTRTYIQVDAPPAEYLNQAILLGATALWEQTWWEEFRGWHASFLDPWGNQIIMWWTENPAD